MNTAQNYGMPRACANPVVPTAQQSASTANSGPQSVDIRFPHPIHDPNVSGDGPDLNFLIDTYFHDPHRVESMRRALRSWFINSLPEREHSLTPFNEQGTLHCYELLDELLSGLATLAIQQTKA